LLLNVFRESWVSTWWIIPTKFSLLFGDFFVRPEDESDLGLILGMFYKQQRVIVVGLRTPWFSEL